MTKIQMIVDGGNASPTPAMAQTLGPMKIPLSEVIKKINEKTIPFKGLKVPVEIKVAKDKTYEVEVGSPPVSELVKKAAGLEKGSGTPNSLKVANLAIEQVIRIAAMKQEKLMTASLKKAVKSICGSCSSAGVLVEGKIGNEICKMIDDGVFDKEINEQKTEPSADKIAKLTAELEHVNIRLKKEMEKLKAAEEVKPTVAAAVPVEGAAAPEAGAKTEEKGAPAKAEEKPAAKGKVEEKVAKK